MDKAAQGNKLPADLSSRNLKDLLRDIDPRVYKQIGLFLIAAVAVASFIYLPIRLYQEFSASNQVQTPKLKETGSSNIDESTTKSNQDQQRKNDVFLINSAIKSYYLKNDAAPANLEQLKDGYIAELPNDPESDQGYKYSTSSGSKSWKISSVLSDGTVFELQGP